MLLTGFAGRAALASTAMALYLACAAGESRAATTIDNIYYDVKNVTCSSNISLCELVYAPVPGGRRLLIQRVNCIVQMANTVQLAAIQVRRKVNTSILSNQTLAPIQEISDHNGIKQYLLNAEAMIALNPTDRPAIMVSARSVAPSITVFCTIHGTLSNA